MHSTLTRLFFLALTPSVVLGLTASDGYNIGVVLGSIVAALLVVAIAGFIFYMFCIRRWLGIGEPPELGYARQNDYNLKKQKSVPAAFGFGRQGKAAPYSGGGGGGGGIIPRDTGRHQGATNEFYDQSRPVSGYSITTGEGAPVALSGGIEQHRSPNASYSSEEMRPGRPGYEVTRTYQQRTYTTQATTSGGSGSPLPAAYLGTGV